MTNKSLSATLTVLVAALVVIATSPCRAIELAHYRLSQVNTDGTAYTTPDSSGRNNTLTLKGGMTDANLVAGKIGASLNFEGGTSTATRDRVEAAENVADFDRVYTQFTFAAWIKPVGIPLTNTFTSFIAGKIGNNPNRGWQIGWTGTDATNSPAHPQEIVVSAFDLATGGIDDEWYSGPTTALANDTWAHVAFTFSGINETENFLRIYINGSKVSELTSTTVPPVSTPQLSALTLTQINGSNAVPFQIGERGDTRADAWRGLIDDVYVFDNALTDAGIAALMTPPPILGDFNQNESVDAADYVLWRHNDGLTPLPNDNGLGTPIGPAHYDLWRSNFGNPGLDSGAGAGASLGATVPEPTSALMASGALIAFAAAGTRGGNRKKLSGR